MLLLQKFSEDNQEAIQALLDHFKTGHRDFQRIKTSEQLLEALLEDNLSHWRDVHSDARDICNE